MNIKTIIFSTILLSVFLFAGCEGGTTFSKRIDNNSKEDITIVLYTIYGTSEPHTIISKESKVIYWDSQMGRFVNENYTCTNEIDSANIVITNNKFLSKDIMDPNNWERFSKDGRNSKEDCVFVISDSDIQ